MILKGHLFLIILLGICPFLANGQNCSGISGKKNKDRGTETFSRVIASDDFYSLLIQKETNYRDTSIVPRYILFLNAASRVSLTDSMLSTTGTFELRLTDSSILQLDKVIYINNPLGTCCSIGFKIYTTEDQIRILSGNPIVTMIVKEVMLTTSFSLKSQKQQKDIFSCLINRKSK